MFRLPLLNDSLLFPPLTAAHETGLLAAGGDLSVPRLLAAYSCGIFPWFDEGDPYLWWSPDPRCVLFPAEYHLSSRQKRSLRAAHFVCTRDHAFDQVIRRCSGISRAGQSGTWITEDMVRAYEALHEEGFAHSVETWLDGELVGGLYGVRMGHVFCGESMFHTVSEASRAALDCLMQTPGFSLIDCQQATPHMLRLGAREISREEFVDLLTEGLKDGFLQGIF